MRPSLSSFFALAAPYHRSPRFDEAERDGKIALGAMLHEAIGPAERKPSAGIARVASTLRLPRSKTIDWRHRAVLITGLQADPPAAADGLRNLIHGSGAVEARIAIFSAFLSSIGLTQTGAHLTICSTLLLALDPFTHPPIRTAKFQAAFELSGMEPFGRDHDAAARYSHAMAFLDQLLATAPQYGLALRDRLDAQGIVWCVGGGWPKGPAQVTGLPLQTEYEALVQARRGQGSFREALLRRWGSCAITDCNEAVLLRASHLKPWKDSDNIERVDVNNGLLLSALFDAALDAGIISFLDDGRLLVSPSLDPSDRSKLGIGRSLRLRHLFPEMLPYIKYHRAHVYKTKNSS